MAIYQELPIGVLNTVTLQRIIPQSGALWTEYLEWLRAGNTPDPYVAPTPAPETLAHAKKRRAHEIRADGLARMQTVFQAIDSFESLALFREVILSIAPAARQLTVRLQLISDIYAAGAAAIGAIATATTVEQVDAIVPAWPSMV